MAVAAVIDTPDLGACRLLTPDEGGDVVAAFGNGYAGPLSFLLRLRHGGDRLLIGSPATTVPGEPRPLRCT